MRKTLPLLALLLLVPGAQAVFIETPLRLAPAEVEAEAGDDLSFDVAPANESTAAAYAGKTLRVRFTSDAETEDQMRTGDAGTVTLDDAATGQFSWVVPQELDDKNVVLSLMDGEEVVATAHVRVGDAEPVMYATGGGLQGGEAVEAQPDADAGAEPTPQTSNDAPGFTALAIVAGAAVAVLLLSFRRARP